MKSFRFDDRSLAASRIAAGFIVLGDLLVRARFLTDHYTWQGVLPQRAYFANLQDLGFPSIYFLSDTAWVVGPMFFLHALVAILLIVGYRTAWVTPLCWYLTVSLQYRNVLVNNGGDILLRLFLFWAMFLPWGRRFSVDAYRTRERDVGAANYPLACFAFGAQVFFLYLFAALNKYGPLWVEEGTALYYTLSVDHITTQYADWLYHFPTLMRVLTNLVIGFEFLAALLLLLPNWRLRLFTVGSLLMMHFSFGVFLQLGIFRYSPAVGLLAFLPSEFWDRLHPRHCLRPLRLRLALWIRYHRYRPARPPNNRATQLGVSLAVLYCFLTCLQGLLDSTLVPAPAERLGRGLGIHQGWPMFTLLDRVKDGWYVIHATLEDGTSIDLISGREPDFTRPGSISETYRGARWRRYLTNVMNRPYQSLLPWYSHYLRQKWSREHPDKPMVALTIFFMNDSSFPDYRFAPPSKRILHTWKADVPQTALP